METTQSIEWTRRPSVTRQGRFFYTATAPGGKRITVTQSWLTDRWLVREGERELPTDWASASEAKQYARICFFL